MNRLPLKVMLWGQEIGQLSWDRQRRNTYFYFNPAIIGGTMDIAPLVAPIQAIRANIPFYGDDRRIYQKLPSFLADSLPDDWGNQLFEHWRTTNKLSNADVTPLEKLSFIGSRGMGALEFVPATEHIHIEDNIQLSSLISLAQRIFIERENAKILPDESLSMQALIAVGTSAGGRQPKAILAINQETGEIRSGQITNAEGFEYYILKFGDTARSSAELEMTYYELATKAGISMMPCQLWEVDGVNHFLTQRFDRKGNQKLHTQTLAALYPDADSYDKLLWVCRKMRLPEKTSEEVFRRMVFNILANNTDDHNKNFSFIMEPLGKWSLSPAYDLTYVFNTGGYQPHMEHCLFIGGKTMHITKQDVLDLAKENDIRQPEKIISEVASALLSFRNLAEKNGAKEEWIGRIEYTIMQHLAAWELNTVVPTRFAFDIAAHHLTDVYIEEAYKGNYHLYVTTDGAPQRFVIRKKTAEHELITYRGISHVDIDLLREIVASLLHD